MHIPRDAHPLLLDDLEDLSRGVAQAGSAIGRSGVCGEEVVEASVDGAEHLLLGADAGEPGAQLHLALLGRGEVGTDLREGAECAVDLVHIAGGQHAQQRSPASFGCVLLGPELLQAQRHGRELVVERLAVASRSSMRLVTRNRTPDSADGFMVGAVSTSLTIVIMSPQSCTLPVVHKWL